MRTSSLNGQIAESCSAHAPVSLAGHRRQGCQGATGSLFQAIRITSSSGGHNRQAVFVTNEDRLAYLATLREFRPELGLKVHGYYLMTNHVHLIVKPGRDATNLGEPMKRLAGRHTRRVNRLERRTGTAWEAAIQVQPHRVGQLLTAVRTLC
jgi:hypothetical protein